MVCVWRDRRIGVSITDRVRTLSPSTFISWNEIVWNLQHLQGCYSFLFQLHSTQHSSSCNEHLSIPIYCASQRIMSCDVSRKGACRCVGCGMSLRFRRCYLHLSQLWYNRYSSQTDRKSTRLNSSHLVISY